MSYLCGCYYQIISTDHYPQYQKHYLPLLNSEVHSTILSTTSRTVLRQTFTNPSSTDNIKECIYTFPLYDGVSVVSFTCRIGEKVLTGLVKEKAKAKKIFDQAIAKGETAGLLEQAPEASDVFSTKLGNIPAGQSVIVEVTYIGELKHHENEGIRFTIPTKIAPRYGAGPSHGFSGAGPFSAGGDNGEIKIVVDINMPEGSFIKGVQSPSHPIAVSMGTVSTKINDEPTMSKASATLALESSALEKDFVLIVQSKDVGTPKAILETHPTIPHHRALMATLVPKFTLPPSRSEIVFVADRSGSMGGNIEMLISAMKVFLKSLPQSVKFNICSFGNQHSFLWKQSQSNSREILEQATNHVSTFRADMGGTETFGAIKATVERRLTDIPLEIILLTDGDIYRQNELFEYVNQQVEQTKGNVRVFPLGIGNGVSHSLIEGLARAGNGFAQAVQIGERLDNAVVRMLRGALSPHITDYTLEVKYEPEIDDDFELIDRVTDGMKVLLTDDMRSLKSSSSSTPPTPKPTISLFDPAVEPEKDALKDIQETTFSLPPITSPKLLQAPHKIPSLFAFSRTTVYLLMSPSTIQRNPIAVILRGTSEHGPLALEIPVETLPTPAETIHQLAAKKAVQDLEESRGWIYDAKDQNGVLVKDKYPSCFDDMVQREAVRLGEKFQIAGKWCSFVAVSANDAEIEEKKKAVDFSFEGDGDVLRDFDFGAFIAQDPFANGRRLSAGSSAYAQPTAGFQARQRATYAAPAMFGASKSRIGGAVQHSASQPPNIGRGSSNLFGGIMAGQGTPGVAPPPPPAPSGGALFGNALSASASGAGFFGAPKPGPSYFGAAPSVPPPPGGSSLFGATSSASVSSSGGLFGNAPPPSYGAVFGNNSAAPAMQPQTMRQQQAMTQGSLPPSQESMALQQQQAQQTSGMKAFRQRILTSAAAQSISGIVIPDRAGRGPAFPPSDGERAKNTTRMAKLRQSSTYISVESPAQPETKASHESSDDEDGDVDPVALAREEARKQVIANAPEMKRMISPMARKAKEARRAARMAGSMIDAMDYTPTPIAVDWSTKSITEKVLALIDLQDFEGWWPADKSSEISKILGVKVEERHDETEAKVMVTLFVVKFFEEVCSEEEGTWGLVVEKARGWLAGLGKSEVEMKGLEEKIGKVFGK